MRALFFVKQPGSLRLLAPVLRALDERGHEVELVLESGTGSPPAQALARSLVSECRGLTQVRGPKLPKDDGAELARNVRLGLDYLRYLEPAYAESPKLRARAEELAPAPVRRAAELGWPGMRRVLAGALRALESSLPAPRTAVDFIRRRDPDVVLATPLVGMGTRQADLLRAARELGIRTAFPVLSWDNLTNKGLLREAPDLVLVWNEAQAAEATQLHGVPPDRIAVTGAPAFDHWFGWEPSRSREAFCVEVGLRADRPFVLYLCSSAFIAEDESAYVTSWLERLRARGGALADVGVLVRPHPKNAELWHDWDGGEQAVVWPRGGEDPLDDPGKRTYFDSMVHSAAVVGINTTALIEAAIAGKPVFTLIEERYRDTQEGTLHFRHLVGDEGLLHAARSFDEHATALEQALSERGAVSNERFLASFVRPHGLDRPAATLFAEALEQLVAAPPAPRRRRSPLGLAAVAAVSRRPRKRAAAGAATTASPVHEAAAIVDRLAATGGPVLAGPWTGDAGIELLYWIPFLRWAGERAPQLTDRLVACSRDGDAAWYADVARGGFLRVADDGDERAALDPEVMLRAHRRLVKERSLQQHRGMFELRPLPPPPAVEGLAERLPERFVAVRIEFSPAFPDTPPNRALAAGLLETLAAEGSVVALGSGLRDVSEQHAVRIDDLLTSATRMSVETAALARADLVVGTYDGLAFLPPLLGVASIALVADAGKVVQHDLEFAQRAFREPPFGRLVTLDVRDLELVRHVAALGAAATL